MMDQEDDRPYRPCVGLMVINEKGHVFVGNRIDTPGDHWQMPQGGIDKDEEPSDAALRELKEEIGTDNAVILGETREWFSYDLPRELSRKVWKGQYRGQTQKWFLLLFKGEDSEIALDAHHPEFGDWQWVALDRLPSLIVPFKRDTYERVVTEFAPLVDAHINGQRA